MSTVAALYVDKLGPYPKMEGVDVWDAERDARLYQGPLPVVAHPPCGPWGQFHLRCIHQERELGLIAVFCNHCWRVARFPQVERALRTLEAPAEQVRK